MTNYCFKTSEDSEFVLSGANNHGAADWQSADKMSLSIVISHFATESMEIFSGGLVPAETNSQKVLKVNAQQLSLFAISCVKSCAQASQHSHLR